MSALLVDSSVMIDYLRGRPPAVAFLSELAVSGVLETHVVVAAEILSGARDGREQQAILELLGEFEVHAIGEADSRVALDMLVAHRLADGVEWNDCLIAAAARRLDLDVATLNEKHFRVLDGVRVRRPY